MIKAVLFDMNETVLNLSLLQKKFDEYFEDKFVLKYWFTKVLHSSTVLGGMDEYTDFGKLTEAALESVFIESGKELTDKTKQDMLGAFRKLPAYDDVPKALKLLKENKIKVIAVSNSSLEMIEEQLTNADIINLFDSYYSVDSVEKYKPFEAIYNDVVTKENLKTDETVMVATHDWDLFGAKKAGLKTAYIKRKEDQFNPYYPEADWYNTDFVELIGKIIEDK